MTFRLKYARICCMTVAAGLCFWPELFAQSFEPSLSFPRSRPESTPITQTEVWNAILAHFGGKDGVREKELRMSDLDLPVAIPAVAGRTLRVSSICWDKTGRRTQFRMECGERTECLPFLAYLRVGGAGSQAVAADAATGAESSKAVERNQWPPASLCRPPTSLALREELSTPVVRAGERATLIFAADGLRMSARVTCLERGSLGEVIRVRGPQGRIFRAKVAGATLVTLASPAQ
jgi:hypothetical protein